MADFKYIEDPEIMTFLREIRRRWPTLAQSADHPLTEYFIHRRGRPGVFAPLKPIWACFVIPIAGILPCFISIFYQWARQSGVGYPVLCFWLIGMTSTLIGIMAWVLRPRRVRSMASPGELLSEDPQQNCWIWLSGLSFAKFLAINVAWHFWLGHGLRKRRMWIILGFIVLTIVPVTVLKAYHAPKAWSMFPIVFFPFGLAFIRFMCSPEAMAYSALRYAGSRVAPNNGSLVDIVPVLMLFALFIPMMLAGKGDFIWLSLLISILCAGIVELARLDTSRKVGLLSEKLLSNEHKFIKLLVPEYQE